MPCHKAAASAYTVLPIQSEGIGSTIIFQEDVIPVAQGAITISDLVIPIISPWVYWISHKPSLDLASICKVVAILQSLVNWATIIILSPVPQSSVPQFGAIEAEVKVQAGTAGQSGSR